MSQKDWLSSIFVVSKLSSKKVETKVPSSKASDSSEEQNSAKKKENTESSAEKNPTPEAIFQAVGVIEGEVESIDNKVSDW